MHVLRGWLLMSCPHFFSSLNLNHFPFSFISGQIDMLINLDSNPGFPNPIFSAVMGPYLFSLCFLLILSSLAPRPGMTSSLRTYLSARCLWAEDNVGNHPSTLFTWTIFMCVGCFFRAADESDIERHTRCVGSPCSLSVCFSFDLDIIQVCPLS